MTEPITGIHHVTAVCSAPQVNVDFYVETLGLRLVKRTVNFDDPGMHHLYYGDERGTPGTVLTFFPIPGSRRGSLGTGMAGATSFSVAPGGITYWKDRLAHLAHEFLEPSTRFGEPVLALHDPDGLPLEIVEREDAIELPGWTRSHVKNEFRLRAFDGVTLVVASRDASAELLTNVFQYREVGEEAGRLRMQSSSSGTGSFVDLVEAEGRGRGGTGTVHHVAFRAEGEDHQAAIGEALREHGIEVTEVRDRQYFRSTYFREPGGVLFEIATDGPGFAIDEEEGELGSALRLPSWLEARREEIERRLTQIAVPK